MFQWLNQRRIRNLPTLDNWSDLGFVEVATPQDFFNVGYDIRSDELPKIKGILCPIPETLIPDKETLSSYYNAVRGHKHFDPDSDDGGSDHTSRLYFYTGPYPYMLEDKKCGKKNLPSELVAIEDLLRVAFNKTIVDRETFTVIYQLNSNLHRRPAAHGPTGIATLDGPTTIMFATNAEGKLVGKKSLPPNSMAVFLGMHAAPDTTGPRFNIVCA